MEHQAHQAREENLDNVENQEHPVLMVNLDSQVRQEHQDLGDQLVPKVLLALEVKVDKEVLVVKLDNLVHLDHQVCYVINVTSLKDVPQIMYSSIQY